MPPTPTILTPQKQRHHIHTLSNGLTLLAEEIPNLRSAALTLLIPAGVASDPPHHTGAASVLSDWILRGAGTRNSRQLTDYLDSLGVQRSSQPETVFLRLSASLLAKNLLATLSVYADIVRSPHLTDDAFPPALDLALQQLDSIDDEPAQKLSFTIRQQHYGSPFGRPSVGIREELESLTAETLRQDCLTRFTPTGAILAIAGHFDWPQIRDAVEQHFFPWPAKPNTIPTPPSLTASLPHSLPASPPASISHEPQDTNQVQIGLAYPAPPEAHPDAIYVHTIMAILSGGMGSRLFSEVREKQGLCYNIHAGYHALKHTAAIFGYSATAPDRAQQTLDSFIKELRNVQHGFTQEELTRAQTGMKSRLILQGESSASRSATLAYDFYHRGRPRTLQEVRAEIDSLTLDALNHYAATHPLGRLTLATIGPKPLNL